LRIDALGNGQFFPTPHLGSSLGTLSPSDSRLPNVKKKIGSPKINCGKSKKKSQKKKKN
jgi:hypothetical protein